MNIDQQQRRYNSLSEKKIKTLKDTLWKCLEMLDRDSEGNPMINWYSDDEIKKLAAKIKKVLK